MNGSFTVRLKKKGEPLGTYEQFQYIYNEKAREVLKYRDFCSFQKILKSDGTDCELFNNERCTF